MRGETQEQLALRHSRILTFPAQTCGEVSRMPAYKGQPPRAIAAMHAAKNKGGQQRGLKEAARNALRRVLLGRSPCSMRVVPRAQVSYLRAWQGTRATDTIQETSHRLDRSRMTCIGPDGVSMPCQCLAC